MSEKKIEKDRMAEDLGWKSYDSAPHVVQNTIDAQVSDDSIGDPFAFLRSGE